MPGLLTLEDMESEVRASVDNRVATDLGGSTRIQRFINHIYLHLSHPTVYKHPQLEATVGIPMVAGQVGYGFQPADPGFGGLQIITLHDITHVFGTSLTDFSVQRRVLRPWNVRRFDRSSSNLPSGATPTRYAKWGAGVFLNVRPAGAAVGQLLQVRFYAQPPPLAAGQVTTILPVWDWIIVKGAEWKLWSSLGVADRADVARQEYARMINDITNIQAVEGEDPGRSIDVDTYHSDAMGPTP